MTPAASEDTIYFDANDDIPYFQAGTDPPPREQWDVAEPLNFQDYNKTAHLIQQVDEAFQATKEIATPLGMDDTGQLWKWADGGSSSGSSQMPRAPPMYPTLTDGTGNAQQQPGRSHCPI